MPKSRDYSMLKVDNKAFNIALAYAEMTPKELAAAAGVSNSVVYAARKGCLVKPLYIGKICKALNIKVEELVE